MPTPYFEEEGFSLFLADCTDLMGLLQPGSVDLIFADPPYNLSNGGFTCHSGRRAPVDKGKWDVSGGIDEDYRFHERWIAGCRRILRENGTIWVSGTYHSIYACGFALQRQGFRILNDICWFKPNAPPNLSRRYFTASHETLLWAVKDFRRRHVFNYDDMKNGQWHENDLLKNAGKQMRSVWSVPAPGPSEKLNGKHPTQKPLGLLKRILTASTREGDVVLDPFTGSSTTGLAAYSLGRNFIGIDSSAEYLDLSIQRYMEMREIKEAQEER